MLLLALGAATFGVLVVASDIPAIVALLRHAGFGVALVVLFHLLPVVLDAAAIRVLFASASPRPTMRDATSARFVGEAVNSLLPAGQLGGPVAMARQLAQRGAPLTDAAAVITVSATMQAVSQVVFALIGVGAFALFAGAALASSRSIGVSLAIATVVLTAVVAGFWWAQRRGLFKHVLRIAMRAFERRDWSRLSARADAIDAMVRALYGDRRKVAATFAWSLAAWIVGTGEVWLALRFLGHPVDWLAALFLESVGQAIRGAAFAIPGALGAQEGGYLLLAPLVGLGPETALALSLVKRAREILLGLPGLAMLYARERRGWRSRAPAVE